MSKSTPKVIKKEGGIRPQPLRIGTARRSSKELFAVVLVASVAYLAFAVVDLLISYWDGDGLSVESVISCVLGVMLLVAAILGRRRSPKMAQYIWESGDLLAPVAEARGTNISTLLAIPLATVATVMIGVFLFDELSLLIFVAVGLLISTAITIGLVRTRVMIQSDSILAGIPSGPVMVRLPFDKVSSVRLRGRVLTVVLTERVNQISPKAVRYLILGNPRPLAAAIQTVGVVHGVATSVENVDIDPELLKSTMEGIRDQRDEAPRGRGDGSVIEGGQPEPKEFHYPTIVSHLLLIAGVSTMFFAYVLTVIGQAFFDDVGGHLVEIECCAMLEFLFGALIIAGALMAQRRKKYNLVRMSAILATISFGGFISTVLGIISLVLLKKSADEFED